MSAIYFHTKGAKPYRIEGRERAHLNILCLNIANTMIGAIEPMLGFPTPTPYTIRDSARWSEMLDRVAILGSDSLTLAARIAGTCECWGWVDNTNAPWLADQIAKARAAGVLRADMGWEGLMELLRQPGVGPAVMSFSVTEQFPDPDMTLGGARLWPADDDEGWLGLSADERWDAGMRFLRYDAPAANMDMQMRPENWLTWRFGDEPLPSIK